MPVIMLHPFRNSLSYPAAVLADSPVAYWRLGETSGTDVADEIGSFPGTYSGGPTLGEPSLPANNGGNTSVIFSGTSQIATFTGFPLGVVNTNSFSIEAWVANWVIPAGQAAVIFTQRSTSSGATNAVLYVTETGAVVFVKFPPSEGDFSGGPIDTSRHHIVYTEDGSTRTMYIDGSVNNTNETAEVFTTTTLNETAIGNVTFGPQNSTINIDEVAIYTHPLTLPQVQAHYNAGTM